MTTDSDRKLEEAKEHLQSSILAVSRIVVGDVSGWDEYTAEFRSRLRRAHEHLLDAKELLNP